MIMGCVNAFEFTPANISSYIALKKPGNMSVYYPLKMNKLTDQKFSYQLVGDSEMPVLVYQNIMGSGSTRQIVIWITALDDVYFNFGQQLKSNFKHDDCLFYMPGFWYRRNLRSPKEAPSFHTSDSWLVRDDRLSTPMTAVYDEKYNNSISVTRVADFECDALATHNHGEIILSGKTSIGYTGFENINGMTALSFGFPYKEAPKTYIRKLTLAPSVQAFQLLKKGESIELKWEIRENRADDFADFIRESWEYSYDLYRPMPVETPYTDEMMKEVLSNFFVESFVDDTSVKYFSGVELLTDDCLKHDVAEVGFVGRTLLNAFNALEYGEQKDRKELVDMANGIFDSYLQKGFSKNGFFNEVVHFKRNSVEKNHSIRRQSEGIYAVLYYLNYEKKYGRSHSEWEMRLKKMLDNFLLLQNKDGSFPRKFKDDLSIVDTSGGSTPSATLPLVMAYKYFRDRRYLEAAKRSVAYLDKELISKSDYFSSTLDANCEDKESSLYASTAAYYLALATRGHEHEYYAELAKKAAYFALSWYYTWDVPFAKGQMLGDVGLKTRGWGNVSVENNHIDVFVFDFVDVLRWLSKEFDEERFAEFSEVITSSMRQLLPYEGHMCGIAKTGFYPEVVQHTNWDYGKNGKGYYNDIFAPGWVVASLWEMLSPGRAENFIR
ncbi:hypothetical protein [uncultured Bacteroides sp.]|uniref:hypothetical protein n=1 Tax=uncultured Bacteroides sp. TaxID=162156 RepID=UPI00262A2D17|nr:hypothetical protein [uncultured Bacteroides sp.]